jgi:hypothetical protein
MPRLNRVIILKNITDAREQLQAIEERIRAGERISAVEYQIMMQHAFHHLNFAWNARQWTTKRYANLSQEDFLSGGKFPTDLEFTD